MGGKGESLFDGAGLRASRIVHQGTSYVFVSLPLPPLLAPLTPAERDVASALAEGLSNAQIARARRKSVRTVANQVASILRKLQVGSRVEAAARLRLADVARPGRQA